MATAGAMRLAITVTDHTARGNADDDDDDGDDDDDDDDSE